MSEFDGVEFCLPGRFLSCLAALGSIRGILKSACNYFLGDAVSSAFKVGVDGTFGTAGG